MNIIKKIKNYKRFNLKKLNKKINFSKIIKSKINKKYISFKLKEKNVQFSYNFYGVIKNDIFYWANVIPGIKGDTINNVKKIKSMSYLFENSKDKKDLFYYQLLTNNMIFISTDKELDMLNSLLMYLDGSLGYFNSINSKGNINLLTIY